MNKLGMHIHGIKPGIIEAVTLLQPRTVTIMDPKPEDLRAIHNASPETFIAMRKYEDGRRWRDTDPFGWAEQCYDMSQGLANGVVAWNEPFGHDDRGSCAPFDEWTYAFWSTCRQLGSMEAVVLCMATGNWTGAADRYKITDDFPLVCANATYFGPHEYSWPTLQAGAGWYALRFKAWIEDLKASGRDDDFSFIISEAGLTQAVIAGRPDEGWRSESPENVTEDSYIATLAWYNAELCKVPEVLGCCLYDYAGQWYGWPTFEQLGLEHRIYQIQAPAPPEPPEPNGGEPMQVKIFDRDGNEKDEAWMRQTYGVTWRRHGAAPDQQVYRLVELREKTGNSSLITKVVNEDGNPMANVDVAFYWSKAPDPPDPPTTVSPYDWYKNFVHGPTNANGDVGPGMGTGAYHGLGECGPHKVWVRDPSTPSDICECLGMVAGTFHDHMDQKFKLTDAEVEPEPPVDDDLLAAVLRLDENVAEMRKIMEEGYVPPDEPPDPEPETFFVEFFNNEDLAGEPVYTMTEAPPFWHDWGDGSPVPGIVNEDHISGRWSGSFTFAAGVHTFNVKTDDGARLWVDDLILDKWYPQGSTLYSIDVPLTAGLHEVVLEWFEQAGGATLHFNWE